MMTRPPTNHGLPCTAEQVRAVLAGCRFTYRDEDQLQEALAAALTAAGFAVTREVRLSTRDRADLLVDGVCVEVKLSGTTDRLLAQLGRYAAHDAVAELLVVTTRARHRDLPAEVGGKRCRVLHLGGVR